MHKWDGPQSFPYVITIFSAPNYCGYYDNKAAVLIIEEGNLSLKQYDETETPYRLPDNMDIFSWSIPFLVEKVISMLFQIIAKVGADDEEDGDNAIALIKDQAKLEEAKTRKSNFKAKLASFTKMQQMYQVLSTERENILKIKNISPDGKLPRGLLLQGKSAIKNHIKQFENALQLDAKNEMRPKK